MKIELKEINTKLNSVEIFDIFKDEENVNFLDSSKDAENLGRYSFIGINPFLIIKGRENKCSVNGKLFNKSVFDALKEILTLYRCDNTTEIPFIGGCIGFLSYDLGLELDEIYHTSKEDAILPHYYFVFYDNLVIIDNKHYKTYITACGIIDDAKSSLLKLEKRLGSAKPISLQNIEAHQCNLESNFTRAEYVSSVKEVKNYIQSGDVYIANLTQRFHGKTKKSSYNIYKDLRKINPAPFSSYMKLEGFDIVSSSPERFLKIQNRKVQTRPIKGTRPRGTNEEEDLRFKEELINSEKDKAELLMIVDLERNDLSKVCKPYSVKVTELFKLEEYSTVFHLVSTIEGELMDEVDAVDCIKACFPGGSITGAPKIRAMEIIDELEKLKRGIYTGSIGYFGFDGNADFNIVIRTIVKIREDVYFGVGGGITWDSIEEDEYRETLDKAKALIKVI